MKGTPCSVSAGKDITGHEKGTASCAPVVSIKQGFGDPALPKGYVRYSFSRSGTARRQLRRTG